MKLTGILIIAGISTCIYACTNANANDRYLDLNTGETVVLKKDSTSGLMVNAATGKPVHIYVDTKTHDTIYGPTGQVVNGKVVKANDGKFTYPEGDLKIKEEANGEYKIKSDDYKKKVEDGEVKIKDGDKKIKIEDGQRKVKKDHNITDKIKKIF
jgi:hypothetical protein